MYNIQVNEITKQSDWEMFRELSTSEDAFNFSVFEDESYFNSGIVKNTKKSGNLGIFLDSNLIGYSQFGIDSQNVAWFSLYIAPKFRGNKFGEKTINLVNALLFDQLNVNSIRHTTFISNSKMIKLLKKTGAVEVGIFRFGGKDFTKDIKNKESSKVCLILEYSVAEFNLNKLNVKPSSEKSYGIDNKEFLDKEINRLALQISINSEAENILSDLLKLEKPLVIMDVGCGIGNITSHLACKFQNTQFIGVEQNEEFIRHAKGNYLQSNIQYFHVDIFSNEAVDLINNSDVFILRVVAQHIGVNGVESFLKKLKEIKKTQKFYIIITDTDDRLWVFEPENIGMRLALQCTNSAQLKYGGDRRIGCKVQSIALAQGYVVKKVITSQFSTVSLGFQLFDQLVEPIFNQKIDQNYLPETGYSDMKLLIEEWKNNPNRFGLGVTLTTLIESV